MLYARKIENTDIFKSIIFRVFDGSPSMVFWDCYILPIRKERICSLNCFVSNDTLPRPNSSVFHEKMWKQWARPLLAAKNLPNTFFSYIFYRYIAIIWYFGFEYGLTRSFIWNNRKGETFSTASLELAPLNAPLKRRFRRRKFCFSPRDSFVNQTINANILRD